MMLQATDGLGVALNQYAYDVPPQSRHFCSKFYDQPRNCKQGSLGELTKVIAN